MMFCRMIRTYNHNYNRYYKKTNTQVVSTVYKAAKQYTQLDINQTASSANVVMPFCYVTLDAAQVVDDVVCSCKDIDTCVCF